MTYYINVWRSSQRIDAEPEVQHWATEERAVEEIVAGSIGFYYDETIRVEGRGAMVVVLAVEPRHSPYDPKARRINIPLETEIAE